jgi:hypothetical protein
LRPFGFGTHLALLEREVVNMSKQVIHTTKGDMLVREDTAKSFRGTHWALIVMALFVLIAAVMFFGGFLSSP